MKDLIAKNLAYLMRIHSINNAQLAVICNVSPQAVGKWLNLNTDATPALSNLITLSNHFGVDLDALIKTDMQTPGSVDELSVPEKIDSFIMQLERLKEEIKKKGKTGARRILGNHDHANLLSGLTV
jgi:transcriptional regulator with XRE-family HTH domain